MKNFSISLLIVVVISFVSCTKQKTEDLAAKAAKEYYENLINGKYDLYVDGTANTYNIPKEYREQLITNVKQFAAVQKEERGAIKNVRVVNSTYNKKKNVADVYMVVCYADSASEEIVVPMIEKKGKWLMR